MRAWIAGIAILVLVVCYAVLIVNLAQGHANPPWHWPAGELSLNQHYNP